MLATRAYCLSEMEWLAIVLLALAEAALPGELAELLVDVVEV
jgi:hypothetical protein